MICYNYTSFSNSLLNRVFTLYNASFTHMFLYFTRILLLEL
jgi:hypothetical protein